jgi:hypothetical protein
MMMMMMKKMMIMMSNALKAGSHSSCRRARAEKIELLLHVLFHYLIPLLSNLVISQLLAFVFFPYCHRLTLLIRTRVASHDGRSLVD